MKVKELMTTEVITTSPAASLKDVAILFSEHGISGLPVVDDGQLLGVVSEGDILMKERGPDEERGLLGWLLLEGSKADTKLSARSAGEAMTSPAITIDVETHVHEAARKMTDSRVNRLPVLDGDEVVGIVTRTDLVRAFVRSDSDIEREIRDDIAVHTLWISGERLVIAVHKGEVSLAGQVDTRADAELLELFAERVPGVVSVQSSLTWQVDEPGRRFPPPPPRRT